MLLTKALRFVKSVNILVVVLPVFCLQLGLAPSAKADVIYDITSTAESLHVKFELPSFEQNVTDQMMFDIATSSFGTVTEFDILGGGTGQCVGLFAVNAPCWDAASAGASFASSVSPAFSGPGTFTASQPGGAMTTVTITEVSSVPEPSSWIPLSLVLAGVGLVFGVARRFGKKSAT